jgi:phage repressor protein C with HTH and peptisase S24 domain
MKTFGERLREARRDAKLSQKTLGVKAGVSQTTISDIERGRNAGSTEAAALAAVLGVEALWFSVGKGPKHLTNTDDEPREPTEDEFALVPQLDISAACGDGRFNDHVVVKGGLAFKKSSLREFGVTEKTARIVFASGGSMSPTIQDGCVVLLNLSDREPKDGKVYAICKPDGGLVLKRLVFEYRPEVGAQVWVMRSDNADKKEHPDKLLPPDDRTMIVGRAIWNDNRL